MNTNSYGIDLGTYNIRIYNGADDSIMIQKNMIATQKKNELFAYGDSAFDMYEKAPGTINIFHPLTNGVIADIQHMETIIGYYIHDISKGGESKPSDYFVAVPTDVTEVEKRAFFDLILEAKVKCRNVCAVEKALADGLGLGIDVKNSQGTLIVDVGYDTTEISIISLGGIVLSRLIKVGGNHFDDSIRSTVRREMGLMIGAKTAETVKIALKELTASGENAVVYGRDIALGLPVERELPTEMMVECLMPGYNSLTDSVKQILERTPPELSADVYRNGLYLTGGASQAGGLAEVLSKGTGLKVNTTDQPIESAALGLSKIINDENYRSLAYALGEAEL